MFTVLLFIANARSSHKLKKDTPCYTAIRITHINSQILVRFDGISRDLYENEKEIPRRNEEKRVAAQRLVYLLCNGRPGSGGCFLGKLLFATFVCALFGGRMRMEARRDLT